MNRGHLITAGRIDDIMKRLADDKKIHIQVASQMEPAVRLMQEYAGVKVESVRENEMIISHSGTDEQVCSLLGYLLQNQVVLTGFHKEEGNLESLFMQLTGGGAQ